MARTKSTGKLTRKIGHQIYDVGNKSDNILYIPKSKSERLRMLRTFVLKECNKCWVFEDPRISTLKREFLYELVDGLK